MFECSLNYLFKTVCGHKCVTCEKRKAFVFSGSSLQICKSNSVIVLPVSVFYKTTIPLSLVGYEMIIANLVLHASLAVYI